MDKTLFSSLQLLKRERIKSLNKLEMKETENVKQTVKLESASTLSSV